MRLYYDEKALEQEHKRVLEALEGSRDELLQEQLDRLGLHVYRGYEWKIVERKKIAYSYKWAIWSVDEYYVHHYDLWLFGRIWKVYGKEEAQKKGCVNVVWYYYILPDGDLIHTARITDLVHKLIHYYGENEPKKILLS